MFNIITTYPDVKELFFHIGFTDITKPLMLQTVGRIMTLEKGCIMKNINPLLLKQYLHKQGYHLIIHEKETGYDTL